MKQAPLSQLGFRRSESRFDSEIRATAKAIAVRQAHLSHFATQNLHGKQLENEGRLEEAIRCYEGLVAQKADTPFCYRRLAIIYRKRKEIDEEMRILKVAMRVLRQPNPTHYTWFAERRKKLSSKRSRG
ncbi:MAG: tetratricopeptide (TPR) repeat protein [Planctomycetota bacterium]|jgi:tetratricopeptide (TPR) repeat protein